MTDTTTPNLPTTPSQDHDSPWKEILEQRFAECLARVF